MAKVCWLFGAGDYGGAPCPAIEPGALVLAVDGGLAALEGWGIVPDLAVGDFDSLGRVPEGLPVLRHPPEKDDTDMLLAAEEGLARGCDTFLIWGGLGARLDHTVANLHLLARLAERGAAAYLLGPDTAVTAVRDGALAFSPAHRGLLSVFAWGGDAVGVDLTGLKYPLQGATLTCDYPLGTSNEFLGVEAAVRVRRGTLLALWQQPELLPEYIK